MATSSHSSLEQLPPEWLKVLRHCVIASVLEIGPNDVFLGEAEYAETPPSHGRVNNHPRIRH